ncbi:hypothetical protein OIE66_24970 [Nonomuraea sp. NBC_01738]|uniref:hypothetical protein n=1 Tax=Nonomuraea sp. NBC_01738 TaxID=2976003 RepID=UPI002E0F72BC|nr:hypothetical protein OIE66_24970 [Nonomuraea sp. NBC_01738]
MGEFTLNIVAGLVVSALLFGAGVLANRLRLRLRLRHLARLIPPDGKVQVVLPSAKIENFEIKGESDLTAKQPPNVLMMPMAEAMGIAQLVLALRHLTAEKKIYLTTDKNVSPDYKLTIAVGGPSVNSESGQILKAYPHFRLVYPDHVAHHGATKYDPEIKDNGELAEDYGFVFVHRKTDRTEVVCCGVWGTGTEAAIKGLLNLPDRKVGRRMQASDNFFMIFHLRVNDVRATDPVLQQYHCSSDYVAK